MYFLVIAILFSLESNEELSSASVQTVNPKKVGEWNITHSPGDRNPKRNIASVVSRSPAYVNPASLSKPEVKLIKKTKTTSQLKKERRSTTPFFLLKMESGFVWSRLEGVDKFNNTQAMLLTTPNLKYGASLSIPLNKHNFLVLKGDIQKVSFEETISNRTIVGMDQTLSSVGAGYVYENKFILKSFVNLEERLYFMNDINGMVSVRPIKTTSVSLEAGYDIPLSSKVSIIPSAGYKYLLAQNVENLKVSAGHEVSFRSLCLLRILL